MKIDVSLSKALEFDLARPAQKIFCFNTSVGLGKTEGGIQAINEIIPRVQAEVRRFNEAIASIDNDDEIYRDKLKETRRKMKRMARVVFAVPSHKLADELVPRLEAEGLSAGTFRGRLAENPETGTTMCLKPKEVEQVTEAGISVETAMCKTSKSGTIYACEHYSACAYQIQKQKLRGKDVVVVTHASLFHAMPRINTRGITFIDEGFWQASLKNDAGHADRVMAIDDFRTASVKFDDPGPGGEILQGDLAFMRGRIASALQGHPEGNIERSRMLEVLSGPERYKAARDYEWKTKVDPVMWPGMPKAAFREALKLGGQNKALFDRVHLWDCLIALVDDPNIQTSGLIVRCLDKNGKPAVTLRKRENIKGGWADGAVVILDATLAPELVQPYFTPELIVPLTELVTNEHVRVLQTVDSSFSASYLIPHESLNDDECNRRINRAREVWRWVCLRALEFHRPDVDEVDKVAVLVICQQDLETLFREWGVPSNVDLAHFNAIRGLDKWGNIRCLITVGRTVPSPQVVEEIAETITGIGLRHSHRVKGTWYPQETVGIRLADDTGWPVENDRHPDQIAEAVRYQICEAELIQAIGRGRGVNRTEKTPLQVDILTNVCLPMVVHNPVRWGEVAPDRISEMVCQGIVPGSFEVTAKAYPDIWASADAVRMAKERKPAREANGGKTEHSLIINYIQEMFGFTSFPFGAFVPGFCQIPGNCSRAMAFPFLYAPLLVADPQAWLVDRLGPVDLVLTGDKAEELFAKRQHMARRKKREAARRTSRNVGKRD
jgi:putative DNA primase/helicase